MDVSQITCFSSAMATAVRQLEAINQAQLAAMKNLAESDQQMAALLEAVGIGQNIDTSV